jgi:ABC-type polysaccharide/polyol phosphate export permease
MIRFVYAIYAHRHAVVSQFTITLKSTVANTRLGPLWWILDPLVLMAIYSFVVQIVFERGGPGYHLYVLCGIVTWQHFSRALIAGCKSLRNNASLIRQTSLPLELYILIPCVVQLFYFIIGISIIAIWNMPVLSWQAFTVLLLLVPILLLPLGLGLVVSVLDVYLPDTNKFLTYVLRIGFYLNPILYSPDRIHDMDKIPDLVKMIYNINPMVHLITAVRDILFTGGVLDLKVYAILVGTSLVLLQCGLLFFRKFASQVPKAL